MHLQYQRVTHEDENFPRIVMDRWGNERVYVEECEGYRMLIVGEHAETLSLDDLAAIHQVTGFYLQAQRASCVPAPGAPAQDE